MVAPKPGGPRPAAARPAFGGNKGSAPKPGAASPAVPMPGSGGGNALAAFFSDVDFDSVESFAQLAVGQHLGIVDNVISNTSSGGHDQLEVTFRIASGPNEGRTTKYWIVKTPNTIWKVKQFLASLGFSDAEMKTANKDNMKGRYTVLHVVESDYHTDGRTRVENTSLYDPDAATRMLTVASEEHDESFEELNVEQ